MTYQNRKKPLSGVPFIYEGESISRLQMDIKCKTYDIRTGKKHLFFNISITNIDTLVPSLYQCIKTHSIENFDCCHDCFRT
jgi:hypothetical protein